MSAFVSFIQLLFYRFKIIGLGGMTCSITRSAKEETKTGLSLK